MISTSAGLNPRAVAGGPSVTRFTHRSCTGIIHSGSPRAAARNMDITSPTLDEIIYLIINTTPFSTNRYEAYLNPVL